MKFNLSNFKNILLLVGIPFILVVLWFRNGLMFAGGEEGIPFYNLEKSYQLFAFSWRDYSGGIAATTDLARIPFFWGLKMLSSISISGFALQAMTFLLLMIVGVTSIYWLLKITIVDELPIALNLKQKIYNNIPIIGAIFYLLNPYSMVQVWGRGLYNQFFPFALLPLFLVLFVMGIKRKNFIYGFMALISSLILSVSFGQPSYIISLWLIIIIYVIFSFFKTQKLQERIFIAFYASTIFILWFLMHSWWIWPMSKTIGETAHMLGDLEYNIGSLKGISRESTLTVVIRLVHKFMFAGIYGNSYLSLPFKFISWLIPLSLIFSISIFKKLKHFKFYLFLFLVSLFIVMGTNMPFGFIFLWLFKKVSIFQVFRNPYEKMGLVLMIAYVPFFAIGAIELSIKIQEYVKTKTHLLKRLTTTQIVAVVVFLVSGIYVWPMWTGQFAGGIKMDPWVKVPAYYKEADDWLNNNNQDSRIIQMPLNPGEGVLTKWDYPYQGIEPSEFLFSNSSIGRNVTVNKIYYNVLLERFGVLQKNAFGPDPDISQSEFQGINLYEELARLNVKFIVLHRDFDERFSQMKTAEETAQYLAKERNIQKVKTIGSLDIYEVKLPKEVAHIYSSDVEITYEKINPVFYTFKVKNANTIFRLNFLESYNQAWELFVDGKKIDTHSTVFSYANSWTIDKQGNYTGYIKYKTQDYVEEGKRVSIMAVIAVLLMTTALVLGGLIQKFRYEKH